MFGSGFVVTIVVEKDTDAILSLVVTTHVDRCELLSRDIYHYILRVLSPCLIAVLVHIIC